MLKQKSEQIRSLAKISDIIAVLVAFGAAHMLTKERTIGFHYLVWIIPFSIVLRVIIYHSFSFYESLRLRNYREVVWSVLKGLLLEALVLGALVFVFQKKETSRLFFGYFFIVNAILVLGLRLATKFFLGRLRTRGYNYRQIIVVGDPLSYDVTALTEALSFNRHWGYQIIGYVWSKKTEQASLPFLGSLDDFQSVVEGRSHFRESPYPVDGVYIVWSDVNPESLKTAIAHCQTLGITTYLSWGSLLPRSTRPYIIEMDGLSILGIQNREFSLIEVFFKRFIDILVGLMGLTLTAVLYPWIAWRIRKESPGAPVIFKQLRVGENGRRFKCYKFRTMRPDAEEQKQLLQSRNSIVGPMFKIDNDPRVFPFGQWLRKTSLDELPQFLNIFRGEMSLVGTRPPTPQEVESYEPHYRRRLSIRPGLTGMWQVSGRSEIKSFEDVLTLDLYYVDQRSVWLDLKILIRTIWVVLKRKGAS